MSYAPTLKDRSLLQVIEAYDRAAKLTAIERLKGGVSADVFRLNLLRADGSKDAVVLRCHGATHCGHDAELEFNLLQALFKAGVPVPKPLCFDTSGAMLEHPFVIMKFVEGSSTIVPSQVTSSIQKMASALALIHGVSQTMPNLPLRVDPVPLLLENLLQGGEWPAFQEYLTGLSNASYQGPNRLLHGDFWPSNLIWSDRQIAAILDWEDAALGDPISDVAGACLELNYIYGDKGKSLFKTEYAKHRTIDEDGFALWSAYVSAAALRHMSGWGLERAREAHMRQIAEDTLAEATALLV